MSHQRERGIIQTLIEVKEGEKLMLTLDVDCIFSSTSSASTRKGVENSLVCFSMTEKSWKCWLNSVTRDAITDTYFSFLAERLAFGKADLISDSAGKCAALKLRSCVSNRRSFTQKAFMCAYRCGTSCSLPCRFLFSVFR